MDSMTHNPLAALERERDEARATYLRTNCKDAMNRQYVLTIAIHALRHGGDPVDAALAGMRMSEIANSPAAQRALADVERILGTATVPFAWPIEIGEAGA